MHEAECAAGKEVRRRIDIAGVFGTEGEGCKREAVRGDVWNGGGEDGCFDGVEWPGWRGVIVRMVLHVGLVC